MPLFHRIKRITPARIKKKLVHLVQRNKTTVPQAFAESNQQGMKLYVGCGPLPLSEQDSTLMGNTAEWVLADQFIQDPQIKPWDAETLIEVADGSLSVLYTSHLLEHISHRRVPDVLAVWYQKLKPDGQIIINVPDLVWLAEEIVRINRGEKPLGPHFTDFDGPYGLTLVVYGSQHHEGEYHKSGFSNESLARLLKAAGFKNISVEQTIDSHDMGVLIAKANK